MEQKETKKLRLLSNQVMALSDIWEDEFCFPNTVEIEFTLLNEMGYSTLKGINLYIDSVGSFEHITKYLGFRVYNYKLMGDVTGPGEIFKLPDYPVTFIYQPMQVPNPIAAIMSGYPPGYGR